MVTKNKPETLYGIQNFGIKKNKKNIDMVTEMVTLFIYMTKIFYMQLFFIRNSFLYAS